MENFLLVSEGVNVSPLRAALDRHDDLWNANPLRAHAQSPHVEADSIWLRFNEDVTDLARVFHQREVVNYPGWEALPEARPLIFALMLELEADRLGRVMVTRLRPGGRITPHPDEGRYSAYYDRFHFVLQGAAGNEFRSGEESVDMLTGQCWWFNNKAVHSVHNGGDVDRMHLIVDLHRPCAGMLMMLN